ncbi:MAG TPA: VWA domain-containing protein [Vicinamibacterales bacterium]|nr:VWA domain-containing protein [Vicinamibacterales bacterium]
MVNIRRHHLAVAVMLAGCATAIGFAQQQRPFVERVDVARVLIDVRVVDGRSQPVPGLAPADFEVRIDGKPARVETAEWAGPAERDASPLASTQAAGFLDAGPAGRLVVFLVQRNWQADGVSVRTRDVGLMRILQLTEPLLALLKPDDQVAVLSFDTHLKIWSDFTSDFDRVRRLLSHNVLLGKPGAISASPDRSLIEGLSPEQGRKTYTIEDALGVVGHALESLPGAKTIVLLGFGFDPIDRTQIAVRDRRAAGSKETHERILDALIRARAAVFSIDFTDADFHTFELGLEEVSEVTGGFYVRANLFAQRAIKQVADSLAGAYVLFVEKPDTRPGRHEVAVKLVNRKGTVLARSAYVD